MNNTFNLNRFSLILKRQWKEFGKIYLVSLLVITGVFILFYALNVPFIDKSISYGNKNPDNIIGFRDPLFIILGFLFVSVISSNYFAHLGQKPRAIIELMLPGSVLEKFLSGVVFTAVLPTISYVLIFHLTDYFYVNYYNTLYAESGIHFTHFLTLHQGDYTRPFYVLPFSVSSLFLLGSIYFNKFHYIKTAGAVMIFSSIFSWVIYKIGRWLFEGKMRSLDAGGFHNLTSDQAIWLLVAGLVVITFVFWVIGYVRLKEKEV